MVGKILIEIGLTDVPKIWGGAIAHPTPTVLTALRVVYVSRWLLDQC
jgi:hypothetical protein